MILQGKTESNITLFDYVSFISCMYYINRFLRIAHKICCKAFYLNVVATEEEFAGRGLCARRLGPRSHDSLEQFVANIIRSGRKTHFLGP